LHILNLDLIVGLEKAQVIRAQLFRLGALCQRMNRRNSPSNYNLTPADSERLSAALSAVATRLVGLDAPIAEMADPVELNRAGFAGGRWL
jgi:hypothetical protein